MTRRRAALLVSSIVVVIASGALATVLLWPKPAAPLFSETILNQANFPIYYPGDSAEDSSGWVINRTKTAYDTKTGVLAVHSTQNGTSITMVLNEQTTPGVFSDVPTQYSKMLTSLNQYDEIQSPFGTITLTHPKELNGGQTAVVNKGSTLLFAKPSADLTREQWSEFFASLRIVR